MVSLEGEGDGSRERGDDVGFGHPQRTGGSRTAPTSRRLRSTKGRGGGAGGIRTPDLIIANDALSQLSYSPKLVLLMLLCWRV